MFVQENKTQRPSRALARLPSWLALAGALGLGTLLPLLAVLPYESLSSGSHDMGEIVERMSTDPPIRSTADVVRLYDLEPNVEFYLKVDDERRIHFEGHDKRQGKGE